MTYPNRDAAAAAKAAAAGLFVLRAAAIVSGHIVCDGRCLCFSWGCPCAVCMPITARVNRQITDLRRESTMPETPAPVDLMLDSARPITLAACGHWWQAAPLPEGVNLDGAPYAPIAHCRDCETDALRGRDHRQPHDAFVRAAVVLVEYAEGDTADRMRELACCRRQDGCALAVGHRGGCVPAGAERPLAGQWAGLTVALVRCPDGTRMLVPAALAFPPELPPVAGAELPPKIGDPERGNVYWWGGAFSGFEVCAGVSIGDATDAFSQPPIRGEVYLMHRCGWEEPIGDGHGYLGNVAELALKHRADGCLPAPAPSGLGAELRERYATAAEILDVVDTDADVEWIGPRDVGGAP